MDNNNLTKYVSGLAKNKKVNLVKIKSRHSMYTEARKINLLEAVLKVSNEATLTALEEVLKKATGKKEMRPVSAHDFLGVWCKEDTVLITKAIEESCEQIQEDEWK